MLNLTSVKESHVPNPVSSAVPCKVTVDISQDLHEVRVDGGKANTGCLPHMDGAFLCQVHVVKVDELKLGLLLWPEGNKRKSTGVHKRKEIWTWWAKMYTLGSLILPETTEKQGFGVFKWPPWALYLCPLKQQKMLLFQCIWMKLETMSTYTKQLTMNASLNRSVNVFKEAIKTDFINDVWNDLTKFRTQTCMPAEEFRTSLFIQWILS